VPAGTAAAKAEAGLKKSARKKGYKGRRADRYVYGSLNKQGMMRGNKTTSKGKRKLSQAMSHPAVRSTMMS